MNQLVIIGGGPAGVAAGVYAARKKIKTVMVVEEFGGQSSVSDDIQNWIGTKSVSGFDLAKQLEEHVKAQEGIEIVEDRVSKVEKVGGGYKVTTEEEKEFETQYLLIATGSRYRRLDVPGGTEFDGRGVAYCATCDAPIFKDKVVAVVGGGNSGLEAVVDLLEYASKIYLLHRRDQLKGDEATQEKIKASDKVEIIYNADTTEIVGDKFVTGLKYKDTVSGKENTLELGGVFVEIGHIPNSDLVKEFVELNKWGEIVVDHKTQRTKDSGIYAAGDVTDVLYNQNNISAGDAIKAVLNIHDKLTGQNREGA